MASPGQFNLLTHTAKIMGKSAYSALQSEISKMQQEVSLELKNTFLFDLLLIGDLEIILKMIARNDPAVLPGPGS